MAKKLAQQAIMLELEQLSDFLYSDKTFEPTDADIVEIEQRVKYLADKEFTSTDIELLDSMDATLYAWTQEGPGGFGPPDFGGEQYKKIAYVAGLIETLLMYWQGKISDKPEMGYYGTPESMSNYQSPSAPKFLYDKGDPFNEKAQTVKRSSTAGAVAHLNVLALKYAGSSQLIRTSGPGLPMLDAEQVATHLLEEMSPEERLYFIQDPEDWRDNVNFEEIQGFF